MSWIRSIEPSPYTIRTATFTWSASEASSSRLASRPPRLGSSMGGPEIGPAPAMLGTGRLRPGWLGATNTRSDPWLLAIESAAWSRASSRSKRTCTPSGSRLNVSITAAMVSVHGSLVVQAQT